jgi:hypothetical protein
LHLPQLQLRGRTAALEAWCAPARNRLPMRRDASSDARHH